MSDINKKFDYNILNWILIIKLEPEIVFSADSWIWYIFFWINF